MRALIVLILIALSATMYLYNIKGYELAMFITIMADLDRLEELINNRNNE